MTSIGRTPKRARLENRAFEHSVHTGILVYNDMPSTSTKAQHASQLPEVDIDRAELGHDSHPYLIGPVELEEFFSECFPTAPEAYAGKTPPASFAADLRNVFTKEKIPIDESETVMYNPLVRAMTKACSWMTEDGESSSLSIRNRSSKRAEQDGRETAVDIIIFPTGTPRSEEWIFGDVFIEVKKDAMDDPFIGDSVAMYNNRVAHQKNLSQFHDYACQMTKAKPRCFIFGVGIFGHFCRFYRWDRSAWVVTRRFNYIDYPETLADFLVRIDCVGQEGRGVDVTATLCVTSPAEGELVQQACAEAFRRGLVDQPPNVADSRRILVPMATGSNDNEVFLSVGPPLFSPKSLFGRGTRTWLAVRARSDDVEFAVLKDAWREDGWRSEGEIYDEIYGRTNDCPGTLPFGVARMDRDVDLGKHGDDPFHHTRVPNFAPGKYRKRRHHRAVLLSVGIPLHKFSSTRQLVECLLDAIIGHENMVKAGLIHRDVSVNNVLISANPAKENGAKGFMIDPEFSFSEKDKPEEGCGVTGTIQFISMNRLARPDLEHQSWHDLESYYWTLLFLILRHSKTNRTLDDLAKIFDNEAGKTSFFGANGPFRSVVVANNPPLTRLLLDLGTLVMSHYKDQETVEAFFPLAPHMFNQLTHANVVAVFRKALGTPGWPTADAAAIFTPCIPPSKQIAVAAQDVLYSLHTATRASRRAPLATEGGNLPSVTSTSRGSKRKFVEVEGEELEGENVPPAANDPSGKVSLSKRRR
ncbi:hypothetical protein JAAARDRAFT_81544 [Jaapia argillacea MUCL 33604]|uniref:Fungal-type protein kinase domain-containing protein n=1 Tax=Jaapia argillacea MUCL 33604 TaxID=933084 RepID=A0A067PLD9_9AGAM|nr:hypothetical protein JAAARDRAFT_81544 [Jaapia argillacea MUCL 33604]